MAESQRTTTSEKAAPGKWAGYSRAKRARWLAAGVCGSCGRARDNGSLTCTHCLGKLSERSRLSRARAQAKKLAEFGPRPPRKFDDNPSCKRWWRLKWQADGLCTSCGGARDVPRRLRCRVCLDAGRASQERQRADPKHAEQSARESRGRCARRQRWIAEGLCGNCGKGPPAADRKECEPCLAKSAARTMSRIRRFRAEGRCVRCGSRGSGGHSLCAACAERATVQWHRRQARLEAAGEPLTLRQWREMKRACGYRCLRCGRKEPEVLLTIDHVVPVSRGGTNGPSNIQPLCGECNSTKATRSTDYRPATPQ